MRKLNRLYNFYQQKQGLLNFNYYCKDGNASNKIGLFLLIFFPIFDHFNHCPCILYPSLIGPAVLGQYEKGQTF